MKLIDSHAHLDSKQYENNLESVLKKIETDLEFVINIGCDLKSSKKSVELAEKYNYIYATVGMHPHDAKDYTDLIEQEFINLCLHTKVLAIGEIGLDYHYDYSPREIQKKVFIKQLKLAEKLQKPVVVHMREATKDCVEILEQFKNIKGILHSYSGSYETALKLSDRFYFSFSGPITFKKSEKLRETVEKIPLERILVETDSPYLTPVPFRGKINSPVNVEFIAKKIAEIKNISYSTVIEITNQNTKDIFEIER